MRVLGLAQGSPLILELEDNVSISKAVERGGLLAKAIDSNIPYPLVEQSMGHHTMGVVRPYLHVKK